MAKFSIYNKAFGYFQRFAMEDGVEIPTFTHAETITSRMSVRAYTARLDAQKQLVDVIAAAEDWMDADQNIATDWEIKPFAGGTAYHLSKKPVGSYDEKKGEAMLVEMMREWQPEF